MYVILNVLLVQETIKVSKFEFEFDVETPSVFLLFSQGNTLTLGIPVG